MGRKIPGRKHRGVRDVDKQRQDRLDKLKDKVDAPPVDKNEQEIPKSLARIMELKEKVKSGEFSMKKKPKLRKRDEPVHFKPAQAGLDGNAGPVYMQASGESDKNFMQRVNKVVQDVLKESAFSEKYKVNIKRNQATGEVEKVEKQEKDPLELFSEQLKKEKRDAKTKKQQKKKQLALDEKPHTSKTQKRNIKQTLKKELKQKDRVEDLVEVRHEHLNFGEVAHAPPTLVKPRRVEKSISTQRPGSKDLLLKNVFTQTSNTKLKTPSSPLKKNPSKPKKEEPKLVDKKGKRKLLPVALRRQLDNQQTEIVKAYKELKKQKYAK